MKRLNSEFITEAVKTEHIGFFELGQYDAELEFEWSVERIEVLSTEFDIDARSLKEYEKEIGELMEEIESFEGFKFKLKLVCRVDNRDFKVEYYVDEDWRRPSAELKIWLPKPFTPEDKWDATIKDFVKEQAESMFSYIYDFEPSESWTMKFDYIDL